ncbi:MULTISPECIES: hypothetical protein [unclassified Ruegeria]|uniref:hypothetical protein n=1 Tax=unclassified Ruegeria TaxID=2625375 RepID=UPI001492258A|nr:MULTISPECIES: hypothetical protein [unclassified Ruegeria]NOD88207.1 hypothetical protein [Ruegeria sp. HKCCD4318]NOE13116.1 hypothetical protein [Ruegeria sp. HKCCD4318-2]NOG11342.1 hypothetical protein [Ruegeria sp. HKCCD4315]
MKDIFNQAMRLNIKYYSGLFDVTKDYLGALRDLAEQGLEKSPPATVVPRPAAPAIQPLILAAPAGKLAEASFAVTNNTGKEMAADPEVSESLRTAGVIAEPAGRMVAHGENVVFTLKGKPTSKMKLDQDIHGSVSVRHFGDREIPVVLRRLKAPAKPKGKRA